MKTQQPPTIPASVFSTDFRTHPAYPLILERVGQSPYLVDMLTAMGNKGNQVLLDADPSHSEAAFFALATGNIHIGKNLFPELNTKGQADDNSLNRFVALLGHEAGHATDPNINDKNQWPRSPDAARQWGLDSEGVALKAEYIVAQQLGGDMWSGRTIQNTLDKTAAATGRTDGVLVRRFEDTPTDWRAFDSQAEQQGAAYYAQQKPSTAPNITYSEYYAEAWAVLNTRDGRTLQQHIDWNRVQSPDIEIVPHANGTFTLVGQAVPMDSGPHAGKRVDFTAAFDADSRVTGETRQIPRPASFSTHDKPPELPQRDRVTRESASLQRNPETPPSEQSAMPLLSEQHMSWLRQAYVDLAPALKAQGLDPDRSLQVAASCLYTAASHEPHWGAPRQFLLSSDGGTVGVQHENLRLETFPLIQALNTPAIESLRATEQMMQTRQEIPAAGVEHQYDHSAPASRR